MKIKITKQEAEEIKSEYKCDYCKDQGYVQERKFGPVHTCFYCLKAGRLG
jgi:hypothetical protein